VNLLGEIRNESAIVYLVVSHDLAVMRRITDQTLVMLRGEVGERGRTDRLLHDPEHPYTRMLLDSIPRGLGTREDRGGTPSDVAGDRPGADGLSITGRELSRSSRRRLIEPSHPAPPDR